MSALQEAARVYVGIARLKNGPEDLPAVPSLLATTIIAYAVVSLGLGALLPPQPGHPVVLLLIDTVLMLVWLKLVLQLARKPERFLQTAMAVFGFQLVLSPLFAAGMGIYLNLREDPAWQLPVSILVVALGVWALVVNTRILQAATQWPGAACAALVIAQALIVRVILLAILPEAPAAT